MSISHYYSNTMLGIIVGAIYLSFAWYAGVAACESYSDRYSRLNGMEFGQIRMWGSLGWAVASSFSGLLFNLSPAYNFMLGSLTSVVMLVVLVSLKVNVNATMYLLGYPRRMFTPCCVIANFGHSACTLRAWRG